MGEWGSLPLSGGVEAAFKGVLNQIKDPLERENEKVRIAKHLQIISNPLRSAVRFALGIRWRSAYIDRSPSLTSAGGI
jgi:hypothetical protein